MARDRLLGPEKAAIFLFSVGEEVASNIIKQLDEDEIKKLGSMLSKTPSISQQTLDSVFTEFHEIASSESSLQIGDQGTQFIKNVLTKAMIDKGKAQTLSQEIQEEANLYLFHKIRRLDPKTISGVIKGEHPQTVAIILAHLDSNHAAGILQELPPPFASAAEVRSGAVSRLSRRSSTRSTAPRRAVF
jgi:flagellar motor switch protein FliG